MSMDFIKRPLWTRKLSDDKLCQYLDALNVLELRGGTDNELLHNTADAYYDNSVGMERLLLLSIDIYKEASFRWYEKIEQ